MPGDGVEGRGWWRTAGWQGGELLKREDGLGSPGWALAGLQSGGFARPVDGGISTRRGWGIRRLPFGQCAGIQGG